MELLPGVFATLNIALWVARGECVCNAQRSAHFRFLAVGAGPGDQVAAGPFSEFVTIRQVSEGLSVDCVYQVSQPQQQDETPHPSQ